MTRVRDAGDHRRFRELISFVMMLRRRRSADEKPPLVRPRDRYWKRHSAGSFSCATAGASDIRRRLAGLLRPAMARRLVGPLLWRPRVRPYERHFPNVSDYWTYVWPSDPRRSIGYYPLDRRVDRAPVIFNSTGTGHRPKTYSIDAVEVCLSSGAWGMMLFGCREPASTATYCLPFTA
jgi:hypothetical protein